MKTPTWFVCVRPDDLLEEVVVDNPDRLRSQREPDSRELDDRSPTVPVRLDIRVSRGAGAGPTRLSAFDTALWAAGLAHYNIIRLSSVIPPYAQVREVSGHDQVHGAHGDAVFCVYAAAYASTPGEQAWAGIAWANHQDHSGAGIFVEHTASSESVVRRDLDATIETMSVTREHEYQVAGQVISSAVCLDHPVCAVVVAAYGTAGWASLIDPEVQQ